MPYRKRIDEPISQVVTLMITEDCNLRCAYCYEENKTKRVMPLDIAKKAVDFVLENYNTRNIQWDFMGGEPLLQIELIDKIIDYIRGKGSTSPCHITTNGTLLGDTKVREVLLKHKLGLSIGLSIDGVKEAHDLNRCNSFDAVMEGFRWLRKEFPWSTTKSTVNRDTLPYISESFKFLYELGLKDIPMNVIYEEQWTEEDAKIYLEQLIKVADYLVEDRRYERVHSSFFSESIIGNRDQKPSPWCGCGNTMITVDAEGNLYPCTRFLTLSNQAPFIIGNIFNGINVDLLRPFYFCHNTRQEKCKECEHASICSHCLGYDYDSSGSIFTRSVNTCEMLKKQVEANHYFFDKIKEIEKDEVTT